MTKKTFKAFADAILKLDTARDKEVVTETCIAVFCQANPRFDVERFRTAAGLSPAAPERA